MATPVYHNGIDGTAFSGATQLAVKKWDMTVKGNVKDVSNSKDGRKRIAGVQDAEGSLMLHWDSANQPTNTSAPNLRGGSILTLKLVTDGATNGFELSAIIDEVHTSSDFDGTIDFDCKFFLESGFVTYPT